MAKKDYTNWDRKELIKEIDQLRKRKKYGLVWEEKLENVVEQCKTELPVLEEVKSKEIITDTAKPINLLIEGDNFHALSVLNYTHKGKIDVIYIDPPYNTGAKDWKYNNDYVDGEDPYRHTKWISFMSHRLNIAKNLLSPDGIICVTIDDYEMPRLWLLIEEIFGEFNHLGTVAIRNNPKGRMTKRKVSLIHEYAVFFGKSQKSFIKKLGVDPSEKTHNYKQDEDETWYLPVNLRKQGVDSNAFNKKGKLSDRYYPIYFDKKTGRVSSVEKLGIEILPIDSRGEKRIWRRSKDVIDEMYKTGDLIIKHTKNDYQIYFKFRGGLDGRMTQSLWVDPEFSASDYGTKILDNILGERELFQYPKAPAAVMQSIQAMSNKKDSIILDFFAGSGTTGQAVLELNQIDKGSRRFILCTNNENNIAEEITFTRIKNVINGYKFTGQEKKIIYEQKLNEKVLTDIDVTFDDLEKVKESNKKNYDKLEVKIEDNALRLYGVKKINGKKQGLGGNLKYFKTSFVPADATDKNKIALTEKTTEMLCIKEDIFEEVKLTKQYKIFRNKKRYLGIIFDHQSIDDFKKEIEKIDGKFSLYIFSLGDDTFDDEFGDMKKKVKLSPIPEAILRVYRRIFK
ncbi:MAG: site-specific DNA-methyltransferase [Patescibacteria group bacterium]